MSSSREMRALARAKSAWVAAQVEDDLTERAASEERLVRAWPRPKARPARPFVLGVAFAAALAAVALWIMRARTPTPVVTVSSPPVVTPGVLVAARPDAVPAEAPPSFVFIGACPECRVSGERSTSLQAGARLDAGTSVAVPRGSRLTLGFALTGALVDPRSGIDLEGPAAAQAADDHTISLERGTARFRGLRGMTLIVPGARIAAPKDATFTVNVDAHGLAHIAVESGHLDVSPTAKSGPTSIALDAGAALDVPGNEPVVAPVAPAPMVSAVPTAPPASEDTVAQARQRFLGESSPAEKDAARQMLESLAQSKDVAVSRRAAFTLAEIELATGQRAHGRNRLVELAACPDVRLAADATTLLARTDPSPAARAATWQSFLATSPPSPYRERAMLERAEALFDAGQAADANAVVAQLRAMPLSEAHQRQLDRLVYKTRNLR